MVETLLVHRSSVPGIGQVMSTVTRNEPGWVYTWLVVGVVVTAVTPLPKFHWKEHPAIGGESVTDSVTVAPDVDGAHP
jgi:hypothetical protein